MAENVPFWGKVLIKGEAMPVQGQRSMRNLCISLLTPFPKSWKSHWLIKCGWCSTDRLLLCITQISSCLFALPLSLPHRSEKKQEKQKNVKSFQSTILRPLCLMFLKVILKWFYYHQIHAQAAVWQSSLRIPTKHFIGCIILQ